MDEEVFLQYGRRLSQDIPLFWQVKQSSAAPVAVSRLLRFRMLEGCVFVVVVVVSTTLVVVGAMMVPRYKFTVNYKIVFEYGKALWYENMVFDEGKMETNRGKVFKDQIQRRDVDI
jgi:hypothetical protein